MAAFTSSSSSSVQHHFLIDSFLNSNTSFSQIFHPLGMENNLDHSTNISVLTNHDPSSPVFTLVNKTSMDSSSIVTADYNIINNSSDQLSAQKVTKTMKGNNIKKRKSKYGASLANYAQSKDMREVKEKKQKKVVNKADEEKKNKNGEKKENEDELGIGYIHVRARRGQATDSHSLAERVRRERISERMKLLQSLVPGCDKVTGKALMLDEIINYVQSLQSQVEFLSSKLASLNPMTYDFGMDLESFMVTPNQSLNSLPSPQQCSPTAVNNNPILENISSNAVLFQPVQLPNTLPQGNRQVLWEVDEQRQKIINQSDFSNNLFSFH